MDIPRESAKRQRRIRGIISGLQPPGWVVLSNMSAWDAVSRIRLG
jgi:hypothetical protein